MAQSREEKEEGREKKMEHFFSLKKKEHV